MSFSPLADSAYGNSAVGVASWVDSGISFGISELRVVFHNLD